jgi:hypothetical protein
MTKYRGAFLILLAVAFLGVVACGNSDEPAPSAATSGPATTDPATTVPAITGPTAADPAATAPAVGAQVEPSPTPPQPEKTARPTAQPVDPAEKQELEATRIMWSMFDQFGQSNHGSVLAAGRNGHPGLVPVLVEAASRTFDVELALEMAIALERITG